MPDAPRLALFETWASVHATPYYDRVEIPSEVEGASPYSMSTVANVERHSHDVLEGFLWKRTASAPPLRRDAASVQQHLEAKHIASILVPVPSNWDDLKQIVGATRAAIQAREDFEESFLSLMSETKHLLTTLIDGVI